LVLENEENQSRRLARGADGRTLHFTAQWNDDLHHTLHVAATGEDAGYYAEYVGDTEKLGRALAEGFAYQGEMMSYRRRPRGEPSGVLPPTAFVAFIQNHDQIGNRAFGDRLSAVASPPALRALAAVYLLLPQIPMLFMGEEWHARQPFPFFCDFDGELANAVRDGRRQEFARFPEFQAAAARERIPDPQSDTTFASAKLDWADLENPEHRGWFDFYRQLLARRREAIVPLLPGIGAHAGTYEVLGPSAVAVHWRFGQGAARGVLTLAANLSNEPVSRFPADPGRTLWQEGSPNENAVAEPWSVRWSLAHR
jgi:maltooligosyltrehalose trehalohydrolase